MRNSTNDNGQGTFDFDRGDQLAMLDAVPIESMTISEGNARPRVSGATIRSVLRAIDSFCRGDRGGWPSSSTIAKTIGRNERSVRRAVTALEELQFVLVEERIGRAPVYRINWGEISCRAGSTAPNRAAAKACPPSRTPEPFTRTPEPFTRTPEPFTRTPEPGSDEAYRSAHRSEELSGPEVRTKKTIQSGGIADRVATLFDRVRYRGDEGHTLWLAVAAVELGVIPQDAVGYAVAAVQAKRPPNPIGYFRTCLAERLELSMDELRLTFRRVRILPRCPGSRPSRDEPAVPVPIRRAASPRRGDADLNERRNELAAQLRNLS